MEINLLKITNQTICGLKELANVEANSSGPLELLFLFNNVPDSLELELIHDENLSLSDSLILNFFRRKYNQRIFDKSFIN